MLDFGKLADLKREEEKQEKKCMWHLVETTGKDVPNRISHHTCSIYGDKMYLIGGAQTDGEPNLYLYVLDLKLFKWDKIQPVH